MLIPNPAGNYLFLPGSATFSSGAIALPGYAMHRATFFRAAPLAQAFAQMQQYLNSIGRPMQAISGIELRSPKPFSFDGFGGFNKTYVDLLSQYGLQLDGKGPAARSNLAPEPQNIAPKEVCVYAFCYTVAGHAPRPQFVAAGSGELKPGPGGRNNIVRLGETSPAAMREKARFCMNAVAAELNGLGVGWADCTGVNIYTVHPVDSYWLEELVQPIGATSIHGLNWYFTRPPIEEIEFEVDARGVSVEMLI